ncbi:MAG TPA: glycosyl transferase family 1 [Chlorobium sp.]|uniref:Glycosyltransferase n=2 Tax=Chlorobium phaeovibrioides TaxID=1094 RepID=A0ABW9UWC6_CHLPH|nr:glycosyltransferase [Chlorobium phaeovibrioides]HCD36243.1 glycosyl transferase family 1 [Chlorobium sp.]
MKNQCFFNMSRYELLENWQKPNCRIAFPYYHGNPTHDEGSRKMLATIRKHHEEIQRIQVSCRFMEEVILDTGIDRSKVFLIPIGVNRRYFTPTSPERKVEVRKLLGIPRDAFVIGSFQKDGNGWGEGLEPKLVKGPDIFLQTLEILKADIPALHVLLTGPARGYVIAGLERLSIPYTHRLLDDYTDIGRYYHALDAYIISSRDEGGPKAVLESMASGVPLISTKVGQATDLISHGENGFLANIEDSEALAHWTTKAIQDSTSRKAIIENGLITAAEHDYDNQLMQWKAFMSGFIDT